MTKSALAEMCVLLFELRPEKLIDEELPVLLQQLANGVMGRTHIDIDLQRFDIGSSDNDTKIAFYYITQEALNNIVKHANARKIKISLTHEVSTYQLMIEDNGVGFDVNKVCGVRMG